MRFQETVDSSIAWLKKYHAWTVPLGLLLVSHYIFGHLFGLTSVALSVMALRYHSKNQPHE